MTTKLAATIDGETLELELVEKLRQQALEGDIAAAKFLLVNCFPERWSVNPNPQKPSPLDHIAEASEMVAGSSPPMPTDTTPTIKFHRFRKSG